MKIYTKKGDKGTTSLVGGKRVSKASSRIDAYGAVDELIAFLGLLRDQPVDKHTLDMILNIQDRLMICAAILASDSDNSNVKIPELKNDEIFTLEKEIDNIEATLKPLSTFIIPGGHQTVSYCHVARTVCRRAERLIIKLSEESKVPEEIMKYINRLSDYLFVLSRKLSTDFKAVEYKWQH
jgi:cob(I)alamin adenosyltransferase